MFKQLTEHIINQNLSYSRYLLLVVAIGLIWLMYPKSSFNFDFEKGKPWQHESLFAPGTFTINKTADQIAAEELSLREEFLPYFNIQTQAGASALGTFRQDFGTQFSGYTFADTTISVKDSLAYLKYCESLLKKVYDKGILAPSDARIGERKVFYIVNNNESTLTSLGDVRTLKQAYQLVIEEELPQGLERDFVVASLQQHIVPNIIYDQERTDAILEDAVAQILPTTGIVQEGEEIITQGAIVTDEKYQKLISLRNTYESQSDLGIDDLWKGLGFILITTIPLSLFFAYLLYFRKDITSSIRRLGFILFTIVLFLGFTRVMVQLDEPILLYFIPFCIIPIILRNFFGTSVALYAYVIFLLLASFILPVNFDFIFLQIVAGLVALLTSQRTYYWSQFFQSAASILFIYCLTFLGLNMIYTGTALEIEWPVFGALFINSMFTLLAYPLIPLFERIFGFTSNITLVELGDFNKPLLRELATKAPGTFWHSILVSNLAEAVAREVGADTLLVKIGSLYHDIGKMENPAFFSENQKTEVNPHDDIRPEESAKIIVNHVSKGIEIGKEYGLPNVIIDFIRTHHGTTSTYYFLRKWQDQHPDDEVEERLFRYPGPLPYNKETAIVMLADSIEAASKSLNNPTEQEIKALVDSIIWNKIRHHQFVNSDLSFKDINKATKIFTKMLKSKYHIRVSYPKQLSAN